jgi:hypothetical protein
MLDSASERWFGENVMCAIKPVRSYAFALIAALMALRRSSDIPVMM